MDFRRKSECHDGAVKKQDICEKNKIFPNEIIRG